MVQLDSKVIDYFPDYVSDTDLAACKPIRLYYRLTMSAGLDWVAMSFLRDDPRQTTHEMYDSRTLIAKGYGEDRLAGFERRKLQRSSGGLTRLGQRIDTQTHCRKRCGL